MVVDAHIHYFDTPDFAENLVREMDDAAVQWSCLMPTLEDSTWEYMHLTFKEVTNPFVLAACRKFPRRLAGGIRLVPTEPGAVEELRRYADTGLFRFVKLFPPQGFWADDERIFPFYETCAEYDLPVLLHMGQTNGEYTEEQKKRRMHLNTVFANPMNLDGVAKMFPEMSFIMAHSGYPYFLEAWSVAWANPNIYFDISGSGPWTEGIPVVYTSLGGAAFIPIDFDRVLWGSDNCLPQKESIARATMYMRQMGAGKAQRAMIFGETARRLFRLD
jgi:predicted TIM-barrel fold metal-dependent hydrolase